MDNPGEFKIRFGRWEKENPGGLAIKLMKHSDVHWIATQCISDPEAKKNAQAYIDANPTLFRRERPRKKKYSNFGSKN